MFDALFQNSMAVKIITNTLFVSIPEELYLVMFTLIMVGEFEYWKEPECKRLINKFDYVRVFLPTIVGALLSNLLMNMGLNNGFFQFLSPIVTYLIIVFTNDIFGDASAIKWIIKTFIFFMIGFLFIGLSELIYAPFLLYGTSMTMSEVHNNFILYLLISLPSRFLQYSLLLYLISKRRTLLKGRLLKNLLSNPILTVIFTLLLITNILFLWFLYKSIVYDKVLIAVPNLSQVFIVMGTVLFPMVNISAFLWSIYFLKNRETNDKKNASGRLYNLLNDIELYTKNEKYNNIKWKLKEIGMDIEEVAQTLYKESETEIKPNNFKI